MVSATPPKVNSPTMISAFMLVSLYGMLRMLFTNKRFAYWLDYGQVYNVLTTGPEGFNEMIDGLLGTMERISLNGPFTIT